MPTQDEILKRRILLAGQVLYPITGADCVEHLQREITAKLPIVSDTQPTVGTYVPRQAWLDTNDEENVSNDNPNVIEHDELSPDNGNQIEHDNDIGEDAIQVDHQEQNGAENGIGEQVEHEGNITDSATIVEHDETLLSDYDEQN